MAMNNSFEEIFQDLPNEIVERLKSTYQEIHSNYRTGKFEPSELNGAKFCETVYRALEWYTNSDNSYTPFNNPISNLDVSVKKFENLTTFPDSVRFQIPKFLLSIYSIRNKRGVGHIGGDINPNHLDATIIACVSKWILAELVRLCHTVGLSAATEIVERIISLDHPLVWQVNNKQRVLNSKLSYKDKAMIILQNVYPRSVTDRELIDWLEYSHPGRFKTDILGQLHKNRVIEYDQKSGLVTLSPKGVEYASKLG